ILPMAVVTRPNAFCSTETRISRPRAHCGSSRNPDKHSVSPSDDIAKYDSEESLSVRARLSRYVFALVHQTVQLGQRILAAVEASSVDAERVRNPPDFQPGGRLRRKQQGRGLS